MKVNQSLWQRLEAFSFDDEAAVYSFTDRLMSENGWTRAYAERVIEEYRKFLYLTQVADGPMTPSEAVDQAWHLHLTYTRSYWEHLCGTVLEWPLHHGPTNGGPEEDRRYREQYAATLEAYRLAFGEPPRDIWPDVETRFRRTSRMQFVDTSDFWLLPKRPPVGLLPFLKVVWVIMMVGTFASFVYASVNNLEILVIASWVAGAAGMFVGAKLFPQSIRIRGQSGGGDGCGGGGCGGCGGCGS